MLNDKSEKGIYAPSYYGEFKCIADQCRHSCCIDWEICIDDAAYEKYKQMGDILATVSESEDGMCFALREDGRCPHLNDKGLCDIIINYGEKSLCEICRNHPRFYNRISNSRTEAGLGIVCEEACRLIIENEKPFSLSKVDELEAVGDIDYDFDVLPERDRIISLIEKDGSFEEKLIKLKREFEIPELYTYDEWLCRFLALEILDPEWESDLRAMRGRPLRRCDAVDEKYDKYYGRLLAYFVYRHVSMARSAYDLRARLAFAVLSVEMIRTLFETGSEQTLSALIDWSRRYSAEIEYSQDNTDELIFAFERIFY